MQLKNLYNIVICEQNHIEINLADFCKSVQKIGETCMQIQSGPIKIKSNKLSIGSIE